MDTIGLPAMFSVLGTFGVPGLIIVLWWLDMKAMRKARDDHKVEFQRILDSYKADMSEIRRMYEDNVSLVKDYHSVASDLKDIVILNTRAMTEMTEAIRMNEFCPMQRTKKKKVITEDD